ncbi:MAG: hypothetical protein LC749_06615, partial [Actinobacteria bacterium]|nr:hypothetical protein [Actinomycetota bacterium]
MATIEPNAATAPDPNTRTSFRLGNHLLPAEVKRHRAMASPAQQDDPRRGDPPTAGSLPTTVDPGSMTRAQLAALPLSTDVALAIAEQHGVCVRPIA